MSTILQSEKVEKEKPKPKPKRVIKKKEPKKDANVGWPRKPKDSTPPVPDFVEPPPSDKIESEPVIQNLSSHPSSPSISQISLEEGPTVNSVVP